MYKDLIGGNVCERKGVEDGEGGERHQTVMLVVNPVKEAGKGVLDFSAALRKFTKALRDGPAMVSPLRSILDRAAASGKPDLGSHVMAEFSAQQLGSGLCSLQWESERSIFRWPPSHKL